MREQAYTPSAKRSENDSNKPEANQRSVKNLPGSVFHIFDRAQIRCQ